jgi:hypothetical protein
MLIAPSPIALFMSEYTMLYKRLLNVLTIVVTISQFILRKIVQYKHYYIISNDAYPGLQIQKCANNKFMCFQDYYLLMLTT